MKRNIFKRTIAVLFTFALMMSMMAVSAFAAEEFTDVPSTMWFHDSVMEAVEKGFMSGYGNGQFGPSNPVTRGQIAQILYNKYGTDVGTESGFSDVPADMWCAKAVTWAVKQGVVSGHTDGTFKPGNQLTRQNMVAILYNQAGKPAVSGDLSKFTDNGHIAAYAKNAFIWATTNGIIGGTTPTTLSPNGVANRGQVATIMLRYDKLVNAAEDESTNPSTEPEKPAETPEQKPIQPETGKTYESAAELVNAYDFTEETKSYIESDGLNVLTNADAVNAVSNVGKQVQTIGYTSTANKNGYHTEATVDVSGAMLDYDAIEVLNKYRANWIKNAIKDPNYYNPEKHDLKWTIGDIGEETALACAKYAKCADYCGAICIQADSVEEALEKLDSQSMLTGFVGLRNMYASAAHYTDAQGRTTYAFMYFQDIFPAGLSNEVKNNYGY